MRRRSQIAYRHTKVICTIGPASQNSGILAELIRAGMNVARLNMSHGTIEEHRVRLRAVREAAIRTGVPVGIMLDLKGPEIRIGTFPGGSTTLREGQEFIFFTRPAPLGPDRVFVNHPGLTRDVEPGISMMLDDGNILMEAIEVQPDRVRCLVRSGGVLSDHKKINLPGRSVSLPALSDKDREDIRFGVREGADFIAASFVRQASDVLAVRTVIESAGGNLQVIAKIESREGLENLEEILKVADGLMVARGDLGVELPPEEIPLHQKRMISRCNALGKPVITATQMLESMVRHPRPTRAEASDVANAIFDGTDAVMLSAESAVGSYPLEAVRMMDRIARQTEEALDFRQIMAERALAAPKTVTEAISHATVTTAHDLAASSIITLTSSGYTARMVAKYRPEPPVIAVTTSPEAVRALTLVWGVTPITQEVRSGTDEMIQGAINASIASGMVKIGDLVVLSAGVPAGIQGTTNLIKVQTVGDLLVRGTGIGSRLAVGRAVIARSPAELAGRFSQGDILVAPATDAEFVPYIEKAAAVITEAGGLTSHAAIAGLSLGIPVVVGASGATAVIPPGETVTVEAGRGLVYRGRVRAL